VSRRRKIAVIGAGFGGLAAAIRLQARGFDVTLIEKRPRPGGRAYRLTRDGYAFDMGPTLVTAPFIIEKVFAAGGKRMRDYVDLVPLDPFYRVYFHDGTHFDYSADAAAMRERMAALSPRDAGRYDDFFRDIKKIYDAVIAEGLGAKPFTTIRSMLAFGPRALRLRALEPVYSFVSRYFKHEFNRFLFSFHPLFIGGSPFRAPSVYIMIPYLERSSGVWFAKGGMYSLVEALVRVFLSLGGNLVTGTEVKSIAVRGGRAEGVVHAGGGLETDAVVVNGDVAWTYKNLIGRQWRRKWTDRAVDRLRQSMSCFLLYLGLRKQYSQLKHHTIVLGRRYQELVKDIFDRKVLPDDFSMYLHAPARTDPSMAPPGCESLYVLAPVPNLDSGIDWAQTAGPFQNRILERLETGLGLSGLRDHIQFMETFTPVDFRTEFNAYHGNAFAIEPRLDQTAYFRPHNRSEDIRGLYFVGAGTHPGGGVPGVLLSAEVTETCVTEDLGPHG
jgi:phytoene desaturase